MKRRRRLLVKDHVIVSFVWHVASMWRNKDTMLPFPSLPIEIWETHILAQKGPLLFAHHVGACVRYIAAVRIQRSWKSRVPWITWAKRNLEVNVCTHSCKGWRRGYISDMHLPHFPMLQVEDASAPGGAYHFFVAPGSACWVIPRK